MTDEFDLSMVLDQTVVMRSSSVLTLDLD